MGGPHPRKLLRLRAFDDIARVLYSEKKVPGLENEWIGVEGQMCY